MQLNERLPNYWFVYCLTNYFFNREMSHIIHFYCREIRFNHTPYLHQEIIYRKNAGLLKNDEVNLALTLNFDGPNQNIWHA